MEESTFTSRDSWPLWLWAFLIFLAATLSLAVDAALGPNPGWIVFLSLCSLVSWTAMRTPLIISVDSQELRVGSASIERSFIASATALSPEEMRLVRGRDANPLCWMALRFWVSTGVKIEISDSLDPTPYWLVSAKGATALAAALKDSDRD